MNVIYDKDPISQWVFGRVALMGEAAHPTTPHGSRRYTFQVQDMICLFTSDVQFVEAQCSAVLRCAVLRCAVLHYVEPRCALSSA